MPLILTLALRVNSGAISAALPIVIGIIEYQIPEAIIGVEKLMQ
jgi:hypothetical protein